MSSSNNNIISSGSSKPSSLLITPAALSTILHDEQRASKLRILDATWFMPNVDRDPAVEFRNGPRIRGAAAFWAVDDVADKSHKLGLKHMMPTAERFAEECSALGIDNDSEVVVYDTHGVFSSPRTVFTFKAFGHTSARVLDGGLPRWIAEGHPVDDGPYKPSHKASSYATPTLDTSTIRSYEQVSANAALSPDAPEAAIVLDARSRDRWTGSAPEPRPGLSSGHMPNSISMPFTDLLSASSTTTPSYKTLLPREELQKKLLAALGGSEELLQQVLAGKKQIVNSCGSGMTAAVLWLALQEIGLASAIYDESWTGYAMRKESKIVKSA